jgi:hypothetical protein
MLFCIANGTLSQVQSKKVKKLSGQKFSPLVEHVAKGVVISLQPFLICFNTVEPNFVSQLF